MTPEEEQMVWTMLDGDWRAVQGDVLVGGLEEMDDAVGDAHMSTELRRLGRDRGVWGVVVHGSSTGRVVAACVVAECRRRVRRRVFQIRAMAVGQEYKWRGLARQAMQSEGPD